eukprot:GILI01007304.1.p1 GENE.GILI01007304.1~~GILI01007304.1.p1  ORF type:complete len:534 (+),score=210.81 GILI01007304.1:81-1604(+)
MPPPPPQAFRAAINSIPSLTSRPAVSASSAINPFATRTTGELLHSLMVFQMCSVKPFVKNGNTLLKLSSKVIGEDATMSLVRHTFFRHFCAGEDMKEALATVRRLKAGGVGAIFDYAAEAAIGDGVHDKNDERALDMNTQLSLEAIKTAAAEPGSFTAVKVTALSHPELLQSLSLTQRNARKAFEALDLNRDKLVSLEELQQGLAKMGLDISSSSAQDLFAALKPINGMVDLVQWTSAVNVNTLGASNSAVSDILGRLPGLAMKAEDNAARGRMMERLNTLGQAAEGKNVRVMVDAEQTYLQPAIDAAVISAQKSFNKQKSIIFNTFQCYLKDSAARVQEDLTRAHREGFRFAAKLVRGAYMNEERRLAREQNYPSPIHDTLQDTHNNYDALVDLVLRNHSNASLCVASHNESSVVKATHVMAELNIPPESPDVAFGQLLGMCDHLTYGLSARGYSAYKYVPYGPVKEVLPYLLRRAEENADIFKGMGKEGDMLKQEIKRRMFASSS